MEKYNVKFKKKLGQNFLRDDSIVKKIVEICDIGKNDLVIEVGPGGAILTRELAKVAKNVLAYEVDLDLKSELNTRLKDFSNVTILFTDFLESDITEDIEKFSYDNIYFVSNVPYYITTPIIMKLINSGIKFKEICMMVQKEVGERFSSDCGNRSYSSITVFLNYFYDVTLEFFVSREEFVPVPNVDSVVVTFKEKQTKLFLKNTDFFEKLVKDSFKYKRKNIRNNLKEYDLDKVNQVLRRHNLSLTSRAEQISVEVFVELANELYS